LSAADAPGAEAAETTRAVISSRITRRMVVAS